MYRRLARKKDVAHDIDVDETSYRVCLLDRRGGGIPIQALSAGEGEKQIFALSLRWLARASHRELPLVIDRPLARLDSEHCGNIVTEYLTSAGPQVFVLSTDTDVNDGRYAARCDRDGGMAVGTGLNHETPKAAS